jgi:hypothetical protein
MKSKREELASVLLRIFERFKYSQTVNPEFQLTLDASRRLKSFEDWLNFYAKLLVCSISGKGIAATGQWTPAQIQADRIHLVQ